MTAALEELLANHPQLTPCQPAMAAAAECLVELFRADGMLLTCGNGGSATDAAHICGELQKAFEATRPLDAATADTLAAVYGAAGEALAERLQQGWRAVALGTNPALLTAILNDQGGDLVFAQQVAALGRAGDVLLGISTSGNAANVAAAVRVARARGLTTIALTGAAGGQLAPLADIAIRVPAARTAAVQELHLAVYHALCRAVEQTLAG